MLISLSILLVNNIIAIDHFDYLKSIRECPCIISLALNLSVAYFMDCLFYC
ncbi:hypothetical protein Sjap_012605 [Stephania japonica]|uniref:Uncharacterized protein n=1 Tax=Stephania japonica TaxID=461633 RepID=A0AAP0IY36_9MAGN